MDEVKLLKEAETFLESMASLEPDVDIECPHCEEPLEMWVGDLHEALEEDRLALLDKIRAALYRGKSEPRPKYNWSVSMKGRL